MTVVYSGNITIQESGWESPIGKVHFGGVGALMRAAHDRKPVEEVVLGVVARHVEGVVVAADVQPLGI